MSNGIRSWSPSAYAEYQKCPRRHKYKKIDRLPDPPGPALERGTAIHKHAEDFVTGAAKSVHPDLKKVAPRLKKLRAGFKKKNVVVELELAFNEKWQRVDWFAPDAWLRLKADVMERLPDHVAITDWKTGKVRDGDQSYQDQLDLYELGALVAGMGSSAKGLLVFTDHGVVVGEDRPGLTMEQVEAKKEEWERRVRPMFVDTLFAPSPNFGCRWCPYSKAKGGPCDY